MKHLSILRHAKSRWDEPGLDDFNRPLNDRGWEASRQIGRELRHRKFRFDLVIASPAARVRETLDGVQAKFDFRAPIHFEQRMYLATQELLLAIVHELPDTVHSALLVGHNPGLQDLLLDLTVEGDSMRNRIAQKFPTAALAVVELAAHHWSKIEPASGKIVELIRPKDLA